MGDDGEKARFSIGPTGFRTIATHGPTHRLIEKPTHGLADAERTRGLTKAIRQAAQKALGFGSASTIFAMGKKNANKEERLPDRLARSLAVIL